MPKGKRMRMVVEPSNLQSFFMGRQRRPDLFTFDATGNAIFKAVFDAEKPTKVFHLLKYETAKPEEIEELYTERQDELEGLIIELEDAKDELRAALKDYNENGGDVSIVVAANSKVQAKEKAMSAIMSPMRAMSRYSSVEIRDVLLENQYEKRKVQQEINVVKGHSILSHSALLVPLSEEAEVLGEEKQEYAIIFDDPAIPNPKEFPLLGLYKPKPLSVLGSSNKKNVYNSLLQAILVETMKANTLKFTPEQIDQVIKASTPGAVRRVAEPFDFTVGDFKDAIFVKVIDAAIDEWSDEENFLDALEETGDKTIVYVAPLQKTANNKLLSLFGTGLLSGKKSVNEKGELVATEANQENPTKWKGLNRWGIALQTARAQWRDTASGGGERMAKDLSKVEVDLAAKTQEQQEAARKGAIIAARRGGVY
jgi:hypothetical protein